MSGDQRLVAFLGARLDEDEANASNIHDVMSDKWCEGSCICDSPARMHREVAAGRAILAEHGPANGGRDTDRCRVCTAITHTGMGQTDARRFRAPCPTLLFLAAVFSNHPDYQQEWALLSTSAAQALQFRGAPVTLMSEGVEALFRRCGQSARPASA